MNQYELKNIYIRDPNGATKGPFPLIATTEAGQVEYTKENAIAGDLWYDASVEEVLNFTLNKLDEVDQVIGIDSESSQDSLLNRVTALENKDALKEEDRNKIDTLVLNNEGYLETKDIGLETYSSIATKFYVDKKVADTSNLESVVDDVTTAVLEKIENDTNIVTKESFNTLSTQVSEIADKQENVNNKIDNLLPDPVVNNGAILRSNGTTWAASQEEQIDLSSYLQTSIANQTFATISTVENLSQTISNIKELPEIPEGVTNGILRLVDGVWVIEEISVYTGEVQSNE